MLRVLGLVLGLAALATPAATAAGRADVAALQAALRVHGGYAGDVDGFPGPLTRGALRAFQRRAGLVPDGIAGPRTRRALGALGRHRYGSRALAVGDVGWDVAVLQFRLETHGSRAARSTAASARTPRPRSSAPRRGPAWAKTGSPGRRRGER
jgi:peptidoglycan hydrolase-like protein with peptidoglycan-binding domain